MIVYQRVTYSRRPWTVVAEGSVVSALAQALAADPSTRWMLAEWAETDVVDGTTGERAA